MASNARSILIAFSIFLLSIGNAISEETAAPFSLPDATGKIVSLSDFKGKYVYLDFWASWCAPCLLSLPWMNELQAEVGEKSLIILAVNVDENRDDADRIIKKLKPNYTVLFDPKGTVPMLYQLPVMPSSYLIGPDGTIIEAHSGFKISEREERKKLIKDKVLTK